MQKNKLQKILIILFFLFASLFFNFITAETFAVNEPSLSCGSAILIDNRTNKILYDKNAHQKMYPASTTKIMTAILSLENGNLNDVTIATHEAITSIPSGYSIANIQVGESLTIEQLLEMLLTYSANDAANVLAEYVGGSIDSFVSMMNTKANELGLTGTHFTNSYGLHDENHFSTAYDLAKLMQYCIKNQDFRKLAGMASCAIPATNMHGSRLFSSTNSLLDPQSRYYTSYVTVGKTGFTSQAGDCLVSVGYNNDIELINVVLNSSSSNSRFEDAISLYEYGYSNYSLKTIAKENDVATQIKVSNATRDTKNLDLLIFENIDALVDNSDTNQNFEPNIVLNSEIKAPIYTGDVLGQITYSVNGVDYSTNLVASHDVEKFRIPVFIIIAVLIFTALLIIYRIFYYTPKKYRKSKKYYKY